ncbi:uncharacterized protein LOC111885816 [Lactuca sativa]|uniref:uncharacterized protein LOC111885816 n=1 Tax=Lactuca sativa TaxID=4236 RepID=UPI000CD90B96|nr:uncharacterized protein LOC111885816 [Lactuca sativa]
MEFLKTFDSDDDVEFVETFFNVVQHIHDEESLNVARTRMVANHDPQASRDLLIRDYFADNCLYNDDSFERRFHLNKTIFLRISNALESHYDFFKQKPDARERMSFSSIQKCAAALRYLGYSISFDASDEYLRVSERTAVECVDWFYACVYESPSFNDIWTGKAPDMTFTVNGHTYKYGYYLGDGIYLDYSTLMNAYSVPRSENAKLFTKKKKKQESVRKDIERAFGVL